MNPFVENLRQQLDRYSNRQKGVIAIVLLGFFSSLVVLLIWANRPDYELLYSNLDSGSANAIVQDLRDNQIAYKIGAGGSSIYVPREHVSEMRLKYVQPDYIRDGIQGYELFETSNMGMTTFMQRLNMKRALEGELTRTIANLPEVNNARVHLVIPEDRLFQEDKKASASVVLHLNGNAGLATKQISGIIALVANSVENLNREDVVVLGSNGELYSRPQTEKLIGEAGGRWELQAAVEADYQRKITDIVEGIVGFRNSVVNVAVDLNFDQIERTVEEVDPEKVALLSEEIYSEAGGAATGGNAERVTSNYELTKKLERFVSNAGDVERITVAVLVNGVYEKPEGADESAESVYRPRNPGELEEIAALVRSSIGFSEERKDHVEVRNLPFEKDFLTTEQKLYDELEQKRRWEYYTLYGVGAVGAIAVFFLLRMLMRSGLKELASPEMAALSTAEEGEKALPEGEDLTELPVPMIEGNPQSDQFIHRLSPEAEAQKIADEYMEQEVIKYIEGSPEDAARLLRTWLVSEQEA